MHTIVIVDDNTHGARIVCPCGFQDKAFSHTAVAAAQHHNVKHRGKYTIRDAREVRGGG